MRRVKIVQIGTNTFSHGNDIFNTLKSLADVFEIVGYCFPENEREKFPERMSDFEGYKELTLEQIWDNPEIEAVAIETEEIYLTKYAIMAVEHNKQVHCEKPGGRELADFKRLIETARQKGKVLHFGYMYRYNPYIAELIQKTKEGELGTITSVEAHMSTTHTPELRDWLSTFKGGEMFFLGCHLIDIILQICGTPKEIIPLNCATGKDDIYTEDFGMAILKYENGVSFAKINSTEIGGFSRRQIVVTGMTGTIVIGPTEEAVPGVMYGMTSGKKETSSKCEGEFRSEVFSRYENMMISFAQMVQGEKENPYSYDYEMELYKTILKCCGGDD